MDNQIAYISGMVFTFITTMQFGDILMSFMLGLIGGFAGILGKELYYMLKNLMLGKNDTK